MSIGFIAPGIFVAIAIWAVIEQEDKEENADLYEDGEEE